MMNELELKMFGEGKPTKTKSVSKSDLMVVSDINFESIQNEVELKIINKCKGYNF